MESIFEAFNYEWNEGKTWKATAKSSSCNKGKVSWFENYISGDVYIAEFALATSGTISLAKL